MKIEAIGPHIVVPSPDEGARESPEQAGGSVQPVASSDTLHQQSSHQPAAEDGLARLIYFLEKRKEKRKFEAAKKVHKGIGAYQKRIHFAKDLAQIGIRVNIKI